MFLAGLGQQSSWITSRYHIFLYVYVEALYIVCAKVMFSVMSVCQYVFTRDPHVIGHMGLHLNPADLIKLLHFGTHPRSAPSPPDVLTGLRLKGLLVRMVNTNPTIIALVLHSFDVHRSLAARTGDRTTDEMKHTSDYIILSAQTGK